MTFRNILVPLDLTEKNVSAIEAARGLASESNGKVTLLHVIETLDLPFEELEDFYGRLEENAFQALETRASAFEEAGIEHSARVEYGERSATIVTHAEENGHDLIVLTSHRVDPENPGLTWATLSYKVAILAQCPVLLVK